MRKYWGFLLLFMAVISANAQNLAMYPSNWWVGMKNQQLQIMIHAKDVGLTSFSMQPYNGVKLVKVHKVESPNYLFVDLQITAGAKPGNLKFSLTAKDKTEVVSYALAARKAGKGSRYAQGVNAKDLIYLIIPDRFANADPSNDKVPGMRDQSLNRDSIFHRHGGDLKGIISKIDYLKDMGVTAIWPLPIWENDMPNRTEHGYAITNHYKVDPRLGTTEDYMNLSKQLHAKGMKLIQDVVYNHCGSYHFTVVDKPSTDWLNNWPSYTNTTYKDQVLLDKYASTADRKKMSDGWFVPSMPDFNHRNPFVANFLIQHAIWSVEQFEIDGYRIDTYAYNDLEFMNRCNKALLDEYPSLSIFGESWVHGVVNQAFLCENNMKLDFNSNLPATTDFQLQYGIQDALTKPFGWTDGVNRLYSTLTQDVLYKNPMRQVLFLDNHDIPRFYSVIGEDTAKYKMAFAWLMTCRGIPQMYYGNEILLPGFTDPDGNVRKDFKGGWKEDKENKFTPEGRTPKEEAIYQHIRKLARFRLQSTAITTGKMMQFVPEDGVYVYFRYDHQQTVMVIMNTNNLEKAINCSRFKEITKNKKGGADVSSGQFIDLSDQLKVPPLTTYVLPLQ